MNATIDMLRRRRSVPPHLLGPEEPSADEIETLLAVASRVPDHGKLAPWRFLVIAGEARARIGDAIAAAFTADEPGAAPDRVAVERNRLARAPLVIGVVSRAAPHAKIPDWEQVLSAGAACMNLVVAANAMGYGTAWLTEWYSYDRRVLDALGLAPHERMAGLIHVGRPQSVPEDRTRPALADVTTTL